MPKSTEKVIEPHNVRKQKAVRTKNDPQILTQPKHSACWKKN